MSVQVKSNDGQSHTVQIYSDISAGMSSMPARSYSFLIAFTEWSSGDRSQLVNWDLVKTDQVIFHEQRLVTQQALSEKTSQALDATTYWGMQQVFFAIC